MALKIVQRIFKSQASIEKLYLCERGICSLQASRNLSNLHQQTFDTRREIKRSFSQSQSYPKDGNNSTEKDSKNQDVAGGEDEFEKQSKEDKFNEEKETKLDDEDEQIKASILSASLQFVPGYGWSKQAVEAGTESLGYPTVTSGIIDEPSISLIHHHYRSSNEALVKMMQKEIEELTKSGQDLKIAPFLRKNVEKRLIMNVPYMSKWPEALAIMAYPQNAPSSVHLGLELVDSMWHLAGDKSVDINWYTKRISLLGIYKTTELAMMQDKSEGYVDTWAFLDRRFEDSKSLQDILGSPDDAIKVLGAIGSTVQAVLGMKR